MPTEYNNSKKAWMTLNDDEIEQRIGAASNVRSWSNEETGAGEEGAKKSAKMRVYNAMVLPTMLYGCKI